MTQARATTLEAGRRAAVHAGGINAFKEPTGIEHGTHLLCIRFPVGGQLEPPTCRQRRRDQFDELGLYQAPLVVAFLRPGVREQDLHFVQRPRSNLLAQDFDADEIALRFSLRAAGEVLAVAEADFQRAGRTVAEQGRQLEPGGAEVHAEVQPVLCNSLFLRPGQPSGTGDEGAHGTLPRVCTRTRQVHAGGLREGSGTGSLRSGPRAATPPWAPNSAHSPYGGPSDRVRSRADRAHGQGGRRRRPPPHSGAASISRPATGRAGRRSASRRYSSERDSSARIAGVRWWPAPAGHSRAAPGPPVR